MLHELVHIVQGEHNDRFYKIWDELRDEWYTLQLKGYTGEGFLGKGNVVGGQRVPVDEARRRAKATALERQKQKTLRKDPGYRLGGSAPTLGSRGQNVRDAIVDAIQRRGKNEKGTGGCGTGNRSFERAAEDALKNGFRTKAEMDDANDSAIAAALIDLMEQEEERVIQGLPAHPAVPPLPSDPFPRAPPASGSSVPSRARPQPPSRKSSSDGLIWDPENGLQLAPPRTPTPPRSAPPVPSHPKPLPSAPGFAPRTSSLRPPRAQLNSQGRPVSRLVQEAEANNRRPQQLSQSAPTSVIDLTSSSPPSSSHGDRWECGTCTLLNSAGNSNCEACDAPNANHNKPADSMTSHHAPWSGAMGWNCWNCGTFMENEWWTCSLCGSMKAES